MLWVARRCNVWTPNHYRPSCRHIRHRCILQWPQTSDSIHQLSIRLVREFLVCRRRLGKERACTHLREEGFGLKVKDSVLERSGLPCNACDPELWWVAGDWMFYQPLTMFSIRLLSLTFRRYPMRKFISTRHSLSSNNRPNSVETPHCWIKRWCIHVGCTACYSRLQI